MISLLLFCNGAEKSSHPDGKNACQGRERSASVLPPCFAPPSQACASAGAEAPVCPITAGKTAAALPEKAGSVRSSEAIFRSAFRVPLSPSGTRFAARLLRTLLFIAFVVWKLPRKAVWAAHNKIILQQMPRNVNILRRFTVPARRRAPARCPGSRAAAARAAA